MGKIPTLYSEEFLTDYRTVDCENPDLDANVHAYLKGIQEACL
jgi:hypothetical protein